MNQPTTTRLLDLFHWSDLVGLSACASKSRYGHHCRLDTEGLCSNAGKLLWKDLDGTGSAPRSNAEAFTRPVGCNDLVGAILERFGKEDFTLHAPSFLLFERLLGKRHDIKSEELDPLRHYLREWMPLSCLGGVAGPLRALLANGTLEDLKNVCQRIHVTEEEEHIQLLCSVHARGWQDEAIWLQTLRRSLHRFQDVDLEHLDQTLRDTFQGRSVERLRIWLGKESDRFPHMIASCLSFGLKLEGCTTELHLLLLETLKANPSSELSQALVQALGRIVALKGEEACLRVMEWLERTSCDQPFHMALRSLTRLDPTRCTQKIIERLKRIEDRVDDHTKPFLQMVRHTLNGEGWSNVDLVTRLSARHGWLQDISDPLLPLHGALLQIVEDSATDKTKMLLCRNHSIPSWLRALWHHRSCHERPRLTELS